MIIRECPELKSSWEVYLTGLPRYVRVPCFAKREPIVSPDPSSRRSGRDCFPSPQKTPTQGGFIVFCLKREWSTLALNNQWEVIWVWFLEDVNFSPNQLQIVTPNELWANSWKAKWFLPVVRSVPIQDQNAHVQNWATQQENVYRTKERRGPEAQKQKCLSSHQKLDTLNHFNNVHMSSMALLCKCVYLVF